MSVLNDSGQSGDFWGHSDLKDRNEVDAEPQAFPLNSAESLWL